MVAWNHRRATYEDVLAAPEGVVAELLFGVLHTNPRPSGPHTIAASRLGTELGGPFDRGRGGPGGWLLLDEPELHLTEDVVVPDVAGWRRERITPKDVGGAFITVPPDFVCEVLSPRTEAVDRSDKMDIYAREGVRHAWLVDPVDQTIEVYALDSGRWVRLCAVRGNASAELEPFDAIALDLRSLWEP